ncbi:hypothetical protein ACFPPA_17585 [Rhodanobacter ginsengisoli]|uniref:Oxidoreductase N-terminal domain-containing protein n=1 Tax=Rhodanobacter ginsengisoli TaxID=418646 RepID=A0ABW0QXI0_9GAMM
MPQNDTISRRILHAARPRGLPAPQDLRLDRVPIPSPGQGRVLLRTLHLSLDPCMGNLMNEAGTSHAPAMSPGETAQPSLGPGGLGMPGFTARRSAAGAPQSLRALLCCEYNACQRPST